ncbi:hypothetical protein KFL_003710090 [Klebsormidium nitens]|uniref:Methyltransferase domain-containing protein n=1 Tax=Klebsormidium nitens TaxID=105231 RepID=A0A1Y1IAW6_KLENI|nr:hypothetical protein KFL_003710090 [Klebsormidium nitens]|eukprot:GAQ87703.1 hypothetical protein KFL_003710090 [Klebsormidium nitens]
MNRSAANVSPKSPLEISLSEDWLRQPVIVAVIVLVGFCVFVAIPYSMGGLEGGGAGYSTAISTHSAVRQGLHMLAGRGFDVKAPYDAEAQHEQLLKQAIQTMEENIVRREGYVSPWHSGHIKDQKEVYLKELLEYWVPIYPCYREVRYGLMGDGGKWLCNAHRLNEQSVIYSIGSNAQTDFEMELIGATGAEVHVFDCTLKEADVVKVSSLSPLLFFHPWCLAEKTNLEKNVYSLTDIMFNLGHPFLDVLKVDCERCEFTSFKSFLSRLVYERSNPPVGQFLVETHNDARDDHKLVDTFLRELETAGFRLFHMEPNWRWWPQGAEWAFVNPSRLK